MAGAGFWDDPEKAQVDIDRLKVIRGKLDPLDRVEGLLGDLDATMELAAEDGGDEMLGEARSLVNEVQRELEGLDLQMMFTGEYDHRACHLVIQAGAGGTEACDWARMLQRMYMRWAESEGFKAEVAELLSDDDSGGVKSATIKVQGDYSYGLLKAEIGVHRLVRISPFDANKRRHTSFSSVDVIPILPEDVELEIDDSELRIDTYRAGGAGGQHVNKTDSAVRITHLPTGIVVQCQNERSQHKNKSSAMKMLTSKLLAVREQEREKELRDLSGEKGEIGFGHQIRSYVFQPYTMVKDHRTNVEIGNIQSVMDGGIRPFLESYLRSRTGQEISQGGGGKA